MPVKLSTTLENIELLENKVNSKLIFQFYNYLQSNNTSESYQNQNIKALINIAKFLGPDKDFYQLSKKEDILAFLNTKIKSKEIDPDDKWIRTWNDYLQRIKYFIRWLYNEKQRIDEGLETIEPSDWNTPSFVKIKQKRSKRISPYLETEIWDRDEVQTIISYESSKRNKAILSLLWDLNARPHEITLLKIKHIRLKERYGEGEIPHQAKTGSGPILLTFSFPYVRDLLNEHPFKSQQEARLICNLTTGAPIKPDQINEIMKHLKERIKRVLDNGEIVDPKEKEKLSYLLKTKKFNPYCLRHSSISADSDHLPEYALKKKVRWSMNSKQGTRYIKNRLGNELKNKILAYNGIISENEIIKKPTILTCPRCEFVNVIENKYCSKCSYPLKPEAYDELKANEEDKIKKLEEKYETEMKQIRNEMSQQFNQLMYAIKQNPSLVNVKPEVLMHKKYDTN
jgi:integrase/recombinase XerD